MYWTISSKDQPINENCKFRTCESELLLNPSLSTFQNCDVWVIYTNQLDWKLIDTLGAWLYALQEPTLAATTCLNQDNKQINLKETGIIRLAPGHNLRMDMRTLPGATSQNSETLGQPSWSTQVLMWISWNFTLYARIWLSNPWILSLSLA